MPMINKQDKPLSFEDKEKQKWDKIREDKQKSINIQTAFNRASEDWNKYDKDERNKQLIKERTKWYYEILKELHEEIK